MSAATSAERLQRLLAMVPWIAAQDGPTVSEVCSRFGITPEQLVSDLDVIWMVGVPPYTPDALVDVVQEGERVWIHYAEVFGSAHRLTPDQALALLSAGATVLALPGAAADSALASGVGKLAELLGVEADQVLDIDLGAASPAIVATLREALQDGRQVRLDYYSYGRDDRRVRDVDPYQLQVQDGSLYLLGWCHLADGERRFRVDRIATAEVLAAPAEPPRTPVRTEVFRADDADPRVVLDLAPSAAWVREVYPVESVTEGAAGHLSVTLAVAAAPWLERLLIGLGPAAKVVDGPPELAAGARRAAARILDRYR